MERARDLMGVLFKDGKAQERIGEVAPGERGDALVVFLGIVDLTTDENSRRGRVWREEKFGEKVVVAYGKNTVELSKVR